MTHHLAVKLLLINALTSLRNAVDLVENCTACEAHILDAATHIREARDEIIREQGRQEVRKEGVKKTDGS